MFIKGDFVKLKDEVFDKIKTSHSMSVNVFEILSIKDVKYTLIAYPFESDFKDFEIEPISINSKESEYIKLIIISLPVAYLPSQAKPDLSKSGDSPELCYLSVLQSLLNEDELSREEFIKKHGLKYVHDVQNLLREYLNLSFVVKRY